MASPVAALGRPAVRAHSLGTANRAVALVLLLTCMFFGGMVFQTQDQAHAFSAPPLPVSLPLGLAGVGVVAGEGAITTVAGTAAAAGAGVAVAPIALAAAAALAVGAATYMFWKWKTGHNQNYAAGEPSYQGQWFGCQAANGPECTASGGYGTFRITEMVQYVPASDPPIQGKGSMRVVTSTGATNQVKLVPLCAQTPSHAFVYESGYQSANFAASAGSITQAICGGAVRPYLKGLAIYNAGNGGYYGRFEWDGGAPAAGATDPTVTTTPTSTCSNGATVTGPPVTYKGSTADADLPPLLAPACPAGTARTGFSAPSVAAGGGTVPSPVSPWTVPIVPSGFPECQPAGNCQLTLTEHAPDGTYVQTCNGTDACTGWNTLPQATPKRTVIDTATGTSVQALVPTRPDGRTYRCKWGPYELKALECSTVPTEKPAGAPSTGTSSGGDSNCNLSDFTLNPVSWVVVPLKCLFIPTDAAVQAAGTALTTAWDGTAPAVVASAVDQVAEPIVALKDDTGPANCQGPPFVIPQLPTMDTPLTLHPLSTCNELTTYLLGIYMPVATAFVYLGGFFTGTRALLKVFNLESPVQGA